MIFIYFIFRYFFIYFDKSQDFRPFLFSQSIVKLELSRSLKTDLSTNVSVCEITIIGEIIAGELEALLLESKSDSTRGTFWNFALF